MICDKCGKDNAEGAKFCQNCGKLLHEEMQKEDRKESEETSGNSDSRNEERQGEKWSSSFWEVLLEIVEGKGGFYTEPPLMRNEKECSFCGSDNTQLVMQNTTDVKTGGYNWASGCCGMCLLGPFGILCGMLGRGSKIKVTNETWWLCNDCGNKCISKSSALEKADFLMRGILGNSCIAGIVMGIVYGLIYESFNGLLATILTVILSAIIPMVLTSINYNVLFKDLGHSVIDILPIEKRKTYTYILVGAMIIIFLIAIAIGVNGVE